MVAPASSGVGHAPHSSKGHLLASRGVFVVLAAFTGVVPGKPVLGRGHIRWRKKRYEAPLQPPQTNKLSVGCPDSHQRRKAAKFRKRRRRGTLIVSASWLRNVSAPQVVFK